MFSADSLMAKSTRNGAVQRIVALVAAAVFSSSLNAADISNCLDSIGESSETMHVLAAIADAKELQKYTADDSSSISSVGIAGGWDSWASSEFDADDDKLALLIEHDSWKQLGLENLNKLAQSWIESDDFARSWPDTRYAREWESTKLVRMSDLCLALFSDHTITKDDYEKVNEFLSYDKLKEDENPNNLFRLYNSWEQTPYQHLLANES